MDGFGPSENYIFYSNDRYNYSVTFKSPKSFKIDSIMNYFDRKYTKDYYIDIDYYPDEV
jgi:predicted RNA-binding protein associated with RNAse of E/G family